jgi:alpha,alpha-trehalose phosphorylase
MAARNLQAAADLSLSYPDEAHRLGVDEEETASWRDAATAMHVPYDPDLRVHQQAQGFTRYQEWDWASTTADMYPLLLHVPYFDLYHKQVVKQADLVLAMHWRGDMFTPEEKARNFAYYEARTVRDSSLSAETQAVLEAEVGHVGLAHDYIAEAALVDLRDSHDNTRNGVHIASLAGAWLGLVAGLGGLRDHDGQLSFAPRLPGRIDRLEFSITWRGLRLKVNIRADEATYSLRDGPADELSISHWGEPIVVTSKAAVTRPIPVVRPLSERPTQPPGRAPTRRFGPPPS